MDESSSESALSKIAKSSYDEPDPIDEMMAVVDSSPTKLDFKREKIRASTRYDVLGRQ